MTTSKPRYKGAYALVIDAHKMTEEEHQSLIAYIHNLLDITNGFTPYEAYIDYDYADDINPISELDDEDEEAGSGFTD